MGGIPTPQAARDVAEAVERRPCDMTDAEREALPTGPFLIHRRDVTAEDRAKGIHGRWIETAVAPKTRATVWTSRDIFAWRDADGYLWDFGQWADGSWFKQASVLS